jgi:hypothetical protein
MAGQQINDELESGLEGPCHGMLEAPSRHLQRRTELHQEQSRGEVRATHLLTTSPQLYRCTNLVGSKNCLLCHLYILFCNLISAAKTCARSKYIH